MWSLRPIYLSCGPLNKSGSQAGPHDQKDHVIVNRDLPVVWFTFVNQHVDHIRYTYMYIGVYLSNVAYIRGLSLQM